MIILNDPENNELLKEFERLLSEGGIDVSGHQMSSYDKYNCAQGTHKWVYYVGLHMDRFWFCSVCDVKDTTRPPPPKPKPSS